MFFRVTNNKWNLTKAEEEIGSNEIEISYLFIVTWSKIHGLESPNDVSYRVVIMYVCRYKYKYKNICTV